MWFGIPVDLPAAQSLDRTWIYFSNAAAAAPSGGPSSVMEFYDSFGGTTLNTTRWTALGTVTTAGDELVLDPGESVRSNTTWPPGHAVDFSMEVPVWSARFWGGFQRSADFNDDEPWLIWISRSGSMIWPEVETSAGGVDPAVLGPMSPVGTAKVIYGIERHAGEVVFRKGQVEVGSIPIPNAFDAALQVRLTNQSSGAIQFGQARVRRVVRPAPEVTVGPVQNYP